MREGSFQVYADRSITCLDCGQEFTFTGGEQEFYAQRGFTEAPKRCTSCRAIRKAQRGRSGGASEGASGNGGRWSAYSAEGSSTDSYGGGYGGGSGGGYATAYRERRPRELYEAICADCGKTATVPFRPSGAKPVYCSDCFQNRR
jgi:CxxC-x17-CxxC domain-containing protein